MNMETMVQTATATVSLDRDSLPRRALRVTPRGASSHFVGSSIVILSSFAVSTLAMNCGKKIQESKRTSLMWRSGSRETDMPFKEKPPNVGKSSVNVSCKCVYVWEHGAAMWSMCSIFCVSVRKTPDDATDQLGENTVLTSDQPPRSMTAHQTSF